MTAPLISIIIPVYNVRKYLAGCLDSALAQNYDNYEIILIDDGSTDDSGKICDQYARRNKKITTVSHQKNHGLSHARNEGIKRAKGEYIMFLDSDDEITPDCLTYLHNLIKRHRTKMAITPINEVYRNHIKNQGATYKEIVLKTSDCLERMLNEEGFTVIACAKLYHATLFNGISFPEGFLHEDVATTYKLIMKCKKIAYGNQPKYNYFIHKDSITSQKFNPDKIPLIGLTDVMCDDIDFVYPELKNTTNLRRMHGRFSILRQTVNANNLTDSQKEFEKGIIAYLKSHRHYVFKNPKSTFRDRFAMRALMLGKPIFKLSWKLYELFTK